MTIPQSVGYETVPGATATRERVKGRRGIALVVIFGGLLVAVAIVGPFLPLHEPNQQDLASRHIAPVFGGGSWSHVLGTDHLGRDVLSRMIVGTRLTVMIALGAVVIGTVVGSTLGMLAGYKRGWWDALISRTVDGQLAIPVILLAIAIVSVRGRSLGTLVGVLALASWVQYVRIVRAETLSIRERPFIMGLRAAGASDYRILTRHVLPNVAGTILVLTTLEVGTLILAESALSFLGLGVVAPDISWGVMLAEGRVHLRNAWWTATLPGAAITAVVLYVNLAGDALHARFDPRRRSA